MPGRAHRLGTKKKTVSFGDSSLSRCFLKNENPAAPPLNVLFILTFLHSKVCVK